MKFIFPILTTAIILTLLVLLIAYICFRIVFYVPRKNETPSDELPVPEGELYEPYHPLMKKWIEEARGFAHEDFYIKSNDGLTLHAKYFEYAPGAPMEIMFHGYRSEPTHDFGPLAYDLLKMGLMLLIPDQRAHGGSEGKHITFGVKESLDCVLWAELVAKEFENSPIILTGVSMGASTVLLASAKKLPKNVVCILADCPYSSPKAILCSVIKQMGFPVKPAYALAKLSAKWLGKFDMEESSAIEAVRESKIPILILHGDADDFVPCSMSMDCQVAGEEQVQLVLIKGAAHGMSHCVDTPSYEAAAYAFFQRTGGISE